MRNAPWIIAVTLFFLGSTAPSVAQVEATDETEAEESLSDLTIPGEPHELLAGTVGEWRLTFRVWTAPDTEPAESTGTAVGRWILGDRFVETVYEGEVMDRPFEALKIEGFEKASKEYVTTWRDNLGTYTMIFRGTCDLTCKTRTMTAEFLDPVSSQRLKIKGVTTLVDEGGYTYESFVVMSDGTEFKNMELVAEQQAP